MTWGGAGKKFTVGQGKSSLEGAHMLPLLHSEPLALGGAEAEFSHSNEISSNKRSLSTFWHKALPSLDKLVGRQVIKDPALKLRKQGFRGLTGFA